MIAQNLSASWPEEGFFLSIRREKGSGQVLLTASLLKQSRSGLAFAIGVGGLAVSEWLPKLSPSFLGNVCCQYWWLW